MHEASIALSLVEGVNEEAARRGITRVDAVHIRVGAMAGVVRDALLFAWDMAAEGSIAQGAELQIEDIPLVVYCPNCQSERTLGIIQLQCPACGAPTPTIVRGRELEMVAMEVPE